MLNPADSRNFYRTFQALALIIAPLLLLVGALIDASTFPAFDYAERLPQIRANADLFLPFNFMYLVAPLAMVPGGLGLIHLVRGARITLGEVGGWLFVLGTMVSLVLTGFGAVEYELATTRAVSPEVAVKMVESARAGLITAVLLTFVVTSGVGAILLAIGTWRRGVLPVWMATTLALSGPLGAVPNKWVTVVSVVLQSIALSAAGRQLLRMSDARFENWEPLQPAPRHAAATTH
ncbi:hypothetical protein RKE30_37980 [Streptomyces sp. Li-HN-5-11]|uniref:hypothetical protein n=1 Tax=Streptomyces sp. Li-HN-5-11 TaxID=3075432 RepID=UPI0028A99E86|nr:hypothetical protein [Streptomyces sp. Li-HN-5-11]WNM35743.1 hypothetical protein RKE30_37980 [Streptomyces sp. Li-HN-5-11]